MRSTKHRRPMLNKFKWYRKIKKGKWYCIYYPEHYLHAPYTEWEQANTNAMFPFYGKVIKTEQW